MAAAIHEWAVWGDYGGDYRLATGYGPSVATMAKSLRILLDDSVATIAWQIPGPRAVELLTANGASYAARCAIITVPLTVLKSTKLLGFKPSLPIEKRRAIAKLQMANVVKVIVQTPPLSKLRYVASDCRIPVWWRLPTRRNGLDVWVGWAGGRSAKGLASWSDSRIKELARKSLVSLFPKSRSNICEIKDSDMRAVNWHRQPFIQGAYSYVPPGAEWCRETLTRSEGRLFFAGEATHSRYPATVTGAVLSGERAAKEVLAVLG